MTLRMLTVPALLVTTLALCSCSTTTTDEAPDGKVELSAQQKELLALDHIGPDEYQKAEASFVKCMRDEGLTVTEETLNPLDSRTYVMILGPPPGGGDVPALNSQCQIQEISYLEIEYLKQNPPYIDPVLLQAIFDRLDRDRIPYKGTEKAYGDFFDIDRDQEPRHREIDSAITETTMELYPDLPYVAMGY